MPASSVRRSLLVGLVALPLLVSSAGARQHSGETEANADNYFVAHPGSSNGRTEVDPFDAYAPVDSGTNSLTNASVLVVGQFSATGISDEWAPPPSPTLPGRPY